MDPLTLGIISGLIVNSLTSIFSHIAYKGKEIFSREEDLKKTLENDHSLETLLQKALTTIAKSTNFNSKTFQEELRPFLVSPDAEAIVRQIYASQLTQSKNIHLKSLRNEFLSSLSLWLNKPDIELEGLATQLFDVLLNGCERALEISVEKGILSAHEAKSSSRHILILDELQTIKKNLAILTARNKPNLREIVEFKTNIVNKLEIVMRTLHLLTLTQLERYQLMIFMFHLTLKRFPGKKTKIFHCLIYRTFFHLFIALL